MPTRISGVTRRERKGTVYWYARVGGRRVYCGKDDKGRELAEAARSKEIVRRYENREMTAGLKVKKTEFKTITDLCNWYMTIPTVQEKKAYSKKVQSTKHLLSYFGKKPIHAAEADEQNRYRKWRRSCGAAEATIDVEIAVLSAMYNEARRCKRISADAVPGHFIVKDERNPRRLVTDEEFDKLLKHADPDFRDVLICAYESAMRSSEISKLTAGQVHLNVRHISGMIVDYVDLGIFDTKTGARRNVPVSARLKEVLGRRLHNLNPEDFVFSDETGPYTNVRISSKMKFVCKRAGVQHGDKALNRKGARVGVVFHCFRHTRTSKWVEAGFSDEIIRRATGHKTLAAYQAYIKLDPSVVMRLVEDSEVECNKNGTKLSQSL